MGQPNAYFYQNFQKGNIDTVFQLEQPTCFVIIKT